MRVLTSLLASLPILAGIGSAACQPIENLTEQVRAREHAFAETMASRDATAFATFLATDAVFVGSRATYRGAAAVTEGWAPFFEGDEPPFSWKPELVEVIESGTLALTSGPVYDPEGRLLGTFNSVWRREKDGQWRVIFDKGCPPCDCATEP